MRRERKREPKINGREQISQPKINHIKFLDKKDFIGINLQDNLELQNICFVSESFDKELDHLINNQDYKKTPTLIINLGSLLSNYKGSLDEDSVINYVTDQMKLFFNNRKLKLGDQAKFITIISHGYMEDKPKHENPSHMIGLADKYFVRTKNFINKLQVNFPEIFNKDTVTYLNCCRSNLFIDNLANEDNIAGKFITSVDDDGLDFFESSYNFKNYRFIFDANLKEEFIGRFGNKYLDLFYLLTIAYNHGFVKSIFYDNGKEINLDITPYLETHHSKNNIINYFSHIIPFLGNQDNKYLDIGQINDFITKNLEAKSFKKQNSQKGMNGIIENMFLGFVINGNTEMVKRMIKENRSLVESVNARGHNALSIAMQYGHTDIIQHLIFLTPLNNLRTMIFKQDNDGKDALDNFYETMRKEINDDDFINKSLDLLKNIWSKISLDPTDIMFSNFINKSINNLYLADTNNKMLIDKILESNNNDESKQYLYELTGQVIQKDIYNINRILDSIENRDALLLGILSLKNTELTNKIIKQIDSKKLYDCLSSDHNFFWTIDSLKNHQDSIYTIINTLEYKDFLMLMKQDVSMYGTIFHYLAEIGNGNTVRMLANKLLPKDLEEICAIKNDDQNIFEFLDYYIRNLSQTSKYIEIKEILMNAINKEEKFVLEDVVNQNNLGKFTQKYPKQDIIKNFKDESKKDQNISVRNHI